MKPICIDCGNEIEIPTRLANGDGMTAEQIELHLKHRKRCDKCTKLFAAQALQRLESVEHCKHKAMVAAGNWSKKRHRAMMRAEESTSDA